MNSTNYFTAFLFGILAFFSACTFPLIPSFIAFLSGISVKELEKGIYTVDNKNKLLLHVVLYITGSCLVLVLLGSVAGAIGVFLKTDKYLLQRAGGLLVIFFGISVSGLIKNRWIPFKGQQRLHRKLLKMHHTDNIVSFLLGIIFTLGWVPCISPILGSILILATQANSWLYGSSLLFVYAVGQNLLLFIFAVGFASYIGYFRYIRKYMSKVSLVTGMLLIVFGIIICIGSFPELTSYASSIGSIFTI